MPWIAYYNGEKKPPRQVPKDVDAVCPTCDGTLRVRGPFEDGTARHFWHTDGLTGGGSGGGSQACESVAESQKHKKWKSLAADHLEHLYEGNIKTCRMEMELPAQESDKDHRRADAIVLFDEPDEILGQGVVIEVQHKNDTKDIDAVTRDLLSLELAVVWTDESDFADDRCILTEADIRHRAGEHVWPEYANMWSSDYPDPYIPSLISDESAGFMPDIDCKRHLADKFYGVGFEKPRIPVKLPRDWYDETARELWRNQDTDDIFSNELAQQYIDEVAESGTAGPIPFDFSKLFDAIPRKLWERHKDYFLSGFETHRDEINEYVNPSTNSIKLEIDFAPMMERKNWRQWWASATTSNPRQVNPDKYEGYDTTNAEPGYVRLFDRQKYKWVQVDKRRVPECRKR